LDLKKNMLTLPYIYSLSNLNKKDKRNFLLQIKRNISKKNISEIKNMIIESGGIKYAMDKIDYFSDMAIDELNNFPDSKYKAALVDAVKFNIEREY